MASNNTKNSKTRLKIVLSLLVLTLTCLFAPMLLTGCTAAVDGDDSKSSDVVEVAREDLGQGGIFDNRMQYRLAELYYRKACEALKDNPSQDWDVYAESGYRLACLLQGRYKNEEAIKVITDILRHTQEKGFPLPWYSAILSLQANCQMSLGLVDEARRTMRQSFDLRVQSSGDEPNINIIIEGLNNAELSAHLGYYDDALRWIERCIDELASYINYLNDNHYRHPPIIDEYTAKLQVKKASYLYLSGHHDEANALFNTIPGRFDHPSTVSSSISYLKTAGRFDEAADAYDLHDSIMANTRAYNGTLDMITTYFVPRYQIYRLAGRTNQALLFADSISNLISPAYEDLRKTSTDELFIVYETHEKELALENSQAQARVFRILFLGALVILLLIVLMLWRASVYNKELREKNTSLYAQIRQHEQMLTEERAHLESIPMESLSASQQLYRRLCELMDRQSPYTDESLNREMLAQQLGTNAKYLEDAIRECSHGETTNAFITRYRLERIAHQLKDTDTPIAIIGEESGIPSRATLARLFRNTYGMSCSEYRKVASKSSAKNAEIISE